MHWMMLLEARPWRPRDAMRVNFVEAVAVLVQSIADGARAVPERGIKDVDVLVDQRLLGTKPNGGQRKSVTTKQKITML